MDQQRWDYRIGVVAASNANFSMGKDPNKPPVEPRDFFPNLPDPLLTSMLDDDQEETDPEVLANFFKAWAGALQKNNEQVN